MRLLIGAVLSAAVMALCACDDAPSAPTNVGYCWRMTVGADGKPAFTPLSHGVSNIETCGAHLEASALRERLGQVSGAYQGRFIFITPAMVQTSMRLKGVRYRLFDAETRAKIDRDLKWMLDDEKHPSKFGPQGPGIGVAKE